MSCQELNLEDLQEVSSACRKSEVIYQVAERFCERFSYRSVLAVQDISYIISSGRSAMIKFNNDPDSCARDFLKTIDQLTLTMEELKDEINDFLQIKRYSRWKQASPQAAFVQKLCGDEVISYQMCSQYVENNNADRVANILLCMIDHVYDELKREIRHVERQIKRELSITKIKRNIFPEKDIIII